MADLKAIRHILANCNREDVTPGSLEDFVLMVFKHNKIYEEKKYKNIPGMGGCLIILPDDQEYKDLGDLCSPVVITNTNATDDNLDFHKERATVARPSHLKSSNFEMLKKFKKVYIFKHDVESLVNFYNTCKSLKLFEKFDNFHLVWYNILN